MNEVIICLLVLCVMPIVCAWIGAYFRRTQLGSVDNKQPRSQALQLTGAGARALAAQHNSWEALAVFSAAVLAVFLSGLELETVATLAVVFVVLRLTYVALYLADLDILRSLVFVAGYFVCLYMFYLALSA